MKQRVAMLLSLLFIGAALLVALLIWTGSTPVGSRHVSLQVTFKLTDLDYNPLPGVPVRLVFCCDKNWQDPNAGYRFVTDAKGEGHFTAPVNLDRRWRKMPTNFIGSLISPPQMTDHLATGVELEYTGFHRMYVVDAVLFSEGTTMQDHFSVYTPNAQRQFSDQPEMVNGDWKFKELGGLMVTGPGYQPWGLMLGHDEKDENWTLQICFKKSPPPVMR